jgi:hypothetical protein
MNFVIQSGNGVVEREDDLAAEAERQGHRVVRVNYVPWDRDLKQTLAPVVAAGIHPNDAFFFGTLNLVGGIHRIIGHQPCFFNQKEMTCREYLSWWGEFSVHRKRVWLPFREVTRQWDMLHRLFGSGGCIFLKPDANSKAFSGKVYGKDELCQFESDAHDNMDISDLVLVSAPVRIGEEYRLFVRDVTERGAPGCPRKGSVVAASLYKNGRDYPRVEGAPPAIVSFSEKVVASTNWIPSMFFIMDVGYVQGEPRLIEIGSVNVCGLYAADLAPIVRTIAEEFPK